MKLITLFLITFLFTTFLNAEYLRTIRLGAFDSTSKAKLELKKLNAFVKKHKNITDLQKSWDFKFKYRKSGAYYATVAEPLRDRAVLQEVLDTLRLSYPDAYVTRLKTAAPFTKKVTDNTIIKETISTKALLDTEVISDDIDSIERDKQDILEIQKELEVLEAKKEEAKKAAIILKKKQKREPIEYKFDEKEEIAPSKKTDINDKIFDIYQVLFYTTLFLLIVVSILLYRYKRKSINCKDREIETHQIFTKKDIEIRHKDSFLTHAKTSVATIHNFTNLLLEFDLTQIQKDYVQRIRSSSEHLLNTVNNTLDITKLKNDTLRIENTEFDLNEMLRKVTKIISLEAKNRETEFELNVEDDVPAFIFGDPTRIRQVLINLLGNSVKFTKSGKISLTIKTLYNYTNAITLGFIVKDTGIGMSTQQVKDILDSNAEIVEGGTVGLGLSVTKQLIELMNGEIKIYSTEDVGTTFTFTLKFSVTR